MPQCLTAEGMDSARCGATLIPLGWPKGPGPPFRRGHPPPNCISGVLLRELSIFIDESGDFGPFQQHSPFYVLSLVLHDQSDNISGHLDKIHDALWARGLPADHAIHTGPLIRGENDYKFPQSGGSPPAPPMRIGMFG